MTSVLKLSAPVLKNYQVFFFTQDSTYSLVKDQGHQNGHSQNAAHKDLLPSPNYVSFKKISHNINTMTEIKLQSLIEVSGARVQPLYWEKIQSTDTQQQGLGFAIHHCHTHCCTQQGQVQSKCVCWVGKPALQKEKTNKVSTELLSVNITQHSCFFIWNFYFGLTYMFSKSPYRPRGHIHFNFG